MSTWSKRFDDASMPFQTWRAFLSDDIVEIGNAYGDTRIGRYQDFWWGYEEECGEIAEGVITKARRIGRIVRYK